MLDTAMNATTATYEPHSDIIWDEIAPKYASGGFVKMSRGQKDVAPLPRASKALKGTFIDVSVGVCRCWLCRDQIVQRSEQNWLFDALARNMLRKPLPDREQWIKEWSARHGDYANEVLMSHAAAQNRESNRRLRSTMAKVGGESKVRHDQAN